SHQPPPPFPTRRSSDLLGHTAAHSPMFVQPPKPSASCCATIETTRPHRSGCPCGSLPRWVTLAAVKSIDEPFGQAATHAPQPMRSEEHTSELQSRENLV